MKIASFLPKSHPLIAFFFSFCMMQKTNERNGQQWFSPPLCLLSEPSLSASLLREVLGCQSLLGTTVLLDQVRGACRIPLVFGTKPKISDKKQTKSVWSHPFTPMKHQWHHGLQKPGE